MKIEKDENAFLSIYNWLKFNYSKIIAFILYTIASAFILYTIASAYIINIMAKIIRI